MVRQGTLLALRQRRGEPVAAADFTNRSTEMSSPMLTDSGLETWLVFHRGIELPDFAAFPLLDDPDGRETLAEYHRDHLQIAAQAGAGIVLETPTWRASRYWGARLGYDEDTLDRVNRDATAFVRELGSEFVDVDVIVSGNLGPRGDGYDPSELHSPEDARA
jgi:homocysteine S-methyltransferase